ncbi:MAG TPA: SWIM zinc finger family protein [Longimicrobiaceae bacterium]|nr:SWIM zinc finger family protein [Longimicrobiaceae bacterium]
MTKPAIDFHAAGGVQLDRLERCLELHVQPTGPGRYRVTGGSEPHWVDLHTLNQPRCDCGDHLWRERICKHILAALLREGNEHVLLALRALVRELRGEAKAA